MKFLVSLVNLSTYTGCYLPQYLPDMVMYEHKAFSDDTEQELALRGHKMKKQTSPYGGGFGHYGNMQTIVWDKNKNKVTAASDKRGIGLAVVK